MIDPGHEIDTGSSRELDAPDYKYGIEYILLRDSLFIFEYTVARSCVARVNGVSDISVFNATIIFITQSVIVLAYAVSCKLRSDRIAFAFVMFCQIGPTQNNDDSLITSDVVRTLGVRNHTKLTTKQSEYFLHLHIRHKRKGTSMSTESLS